MSSEDTKILEFNQYQKSDKAPFIIYADLECIATHLQLHLILSEHITGFSMLIISSFRNIENKHHLYRGQNCMKKFCESLREHAMKIINLKKK